MNYEECIWNAYIELVSVLYDDSGKEANRADLENAIETAIGYLGQIL